MRRLAVALLIAATLTIAPRLGSQSLHPTRVLSPTRILLLYAPPPEAPGIVAFTQRLRIRLRQGLTSRVEFYEEYLDLVRFPGLERTGQLARYFGEKYGSFRIDAIVAVGAPALTFATERFAVLFPGVPVVFALPFAAAVDTAALPANVSGRLLTVPLGATLALARRLQPDAERLVVIGGATRADSDAVSSALSAFNPIAEGLDVTVLQGPPLKELITRVAKLPPRTIIFFADFERDASGQAFTPADVAARVAAHANAPVYGYLANWLGLGIVGGALVDTEEEGEMAAKRVIAALSHGPAVSPRIDTTAGVPAVDARALARWGLSEARLPVGTTVEFRTATTWQRHRTVILVAIVLIAAQALLIGQLLLNRRQRIRAQAAVEHQLSYVAHIARVATVGELAATLAHELRQPLAAILLNAQAGAQMLAKDPPELDEVREILDDISADDARAADVIDRIGALLRREQPRFEQVDLNEVCRGVRRLLQSAAAIRRATIDLALDPELPTIMGDPVQLQQVVLNLALNGLDATASCEGDRTVTLGTGMNGVVAELTVGDSGRGLSAESGHRLFEPFYSTKSQGLGMGLAIVRSIVERHGGRVHARNQTSGGAVFRVLLPLESRYRGPMAPTVEGAVITPQRFEPERAPALAAARSPASS